MAGPPYSGPVSYPPVDVTEVAVGIDGDFLYMRVTYAGIVPSIVVHVPANGEVEEQWITNQGMNIALNTDGDQGTGGSGEGVSGVDIFFAVSFEYGQRHQVYTNWDFPDGDIHNHVGHLEGELGEGGPGFDYALARYPITTLGAFLPRGSTVEIGSWSEAESYDGAGNLLYHHFAFDRVIDGQSWVIP